MPGRGHSRSLEVFPVENARSNPVQVTGGRWLPATSFFPWPKAAAWQG